jgi:hypothetical protein
MTRSPILLKYPLKRSMHAVEVFNETEGSEIVNVHITVDRTTSNNLLLYPGPITAKIIRDGGNLWVAMDADGFSSPRRYQTHCLSDPRIIRGSSEK